ncbi:minor capsid protein [Caulobacter hibisci]|uniref:Minor capsid protein n=2 Tax=Caulobacter hibisci TaxID=2035993 RepID=A0ABS0SS93_9CAUL|nr:minor capsid protein [Caulobacter hibisci]
MARRQTNRRGSIDLRIIIPTQALEDDLARIYMKVVRAWAVAARDRVMPAYRQALERRAARDGMVLDDAASLGDLFRDLGPEFERLVLSLTPEMRDWVLQVERWHRDKWGSSVLTATGVDLATMLGPADAQQALADILAWNVSLISDVSAQAQSKIAAEVFAGYQRRAPAREVAKDIQEILQTSRRRALFIASDQLNKLSSELDAERQRQAGLDEWKWRASGKLHPRLWHKERDGNIYTDKTAPEDLPGQLPRCGCKRQAHLSL